MEFVRHNQTLTTILLKIKDDVKCDYETALAWALSAKNSLSNNNGYRPTQLLLGKNPNLPNFIENNLPAQEPSTKSFHIATRLTALHAARKAFIESESSNKLKTALRKNTRSFFNTYNIGDEVFYKRNDSPEWKGPGKVLGQDGSVLFIRHGSRYVKVHLCRVQPVHIQKSNHPILIIHQTSNHPILIIHQTPILTPMLNILTYAVT